MIDLSNVVVIIPAYEPSKNFIDYANELLKNSFLQLIVINDGSQKKYDEVFTNIEKMERVTLLSYEENHGKGYALKTAFKYCKENYAKGVVFVTCDCDGQHLVKDVLAVAENSYCNPEKFTLGVRDFNNAKVPKRSAMGNKNTRFLYNFLYGIKLTDTQTGLRGFSYELLDKLIDISGDRFEYEMNQLIKLHKQEVEIEEVPIETIYEDKPDDVEKRSHFKTFSDSLRVVGVLLRNLNWYLVSSAVSAIIDIVAFYLLSKYVFINGANAFNVLYATVSARIISSIFNFIFNFKFVFNGKSKRAVFRYYILWTVQLSCSYGLASLWKLAFPTNDLVLLLTICKGATDLMLSVLSYQIQSRWVFKNKKRIR